MLKTILDVNRWRGYIWYFLYYSYVQFFTSKGTMEIDRAGIKTCETLQHVRLIYLKRTLFDLAGTKNSSWTDRICFWQNMKIFAEIEFRQKRIIPFSCSSYFVSESYLTHNTYIFFWLSYWLGNIDSSPKLFVRFEVPPNQKVCVLDKSVLFFC